MPLARPLWILIAIFGWLVFAEHVSAQPAASGPKPVSFVRDVRPILSRNCFACHGPDEAKRKAGLRLDIREGAFGVIDGLRAFEPGDVDESEALRRVISNDPEERMPPAKDAKPLSAEQVDILRRWVEQGAKWESHWAFEAPIRHVLPHVEDASWSRNPIDRFVLARLEADRMRPSPEADRRTLIRRVCLDLTGLPPTPRMVAEFLEDRAPDAYEALVDRLLQSPSYGERWARVWLDLARFADTKGYEKDLRRTNWRYRDWVIEAFNADMPYDRFTVEQLAGDLLPDASPAQVLATAFHRNTLSNDEGGTDDEEFRIAAVKDRVDTTVQVWMGLTMGCAKCHSHKYDPIAHSEYYQFYAVFNQTEDSDKPDDRPTVPFPTRDQQARIDHLQGRVRDLEAGLRAASPGRDRAQARWEDTLRGRASWSVLRPDRMEASSGSNLTVQPDLSVLAGGPGPSKEAYTLGFRPSIPRVGAIRLEALPDPTLPKGGVGRSPNDGNFVLSGISAAIRGKDGRERALRFARAEADFAQTDYPVAHALENPDPKKHGWAVAPEQTQPHQAVFRLAEAVAPGDGELVIRLNHRFEFAYPGFSLGRFRLSAAEDPGTPLKSELPGPIAAILAVPPARRTETQSRALLEHYVANAPETQQVRAEVAGMRAEIDAILNSARTPVFRELPADKRRTTRIHRRGNFLDPGDTVEPATPSAFPPLSRGVPANRLGVARWLMDPANPLTARVAVNRHWAQFFGRGLVESQEDFGSQGQAPSHPELLDWLAVDFRDGGWSFKRLCRRIVTSATYRQSSRATPEGLENDRSNRLLGRGPRFRMEAEMIRDSALAVSGLLSRTMLGPSVMPAQPEGIWRSTYNTETWTLSPGADRYRRGLYTFVKRTSPYPAMLTFDAPSRESCTIRRLNTNTPLQALVTLNDAVYIEAAQALARQAVRESGPSPAGRIASAFEDALVRPPSPRELEALAGLYRRLLVAYRDDLESARTLATDPLGPLPEGWDPAEAAALTSVCNAILNLDEFLTRG